MKKFLFSVLAILFFANYAQAQAYEGMIKIKKVEEPAIIMMYRYPASVVENAFKAHLTDKRLKGSKSNGFLVYANSIIGEIAPMPLDYSFKFDKSGKKDKEVTTVYLRMLGANALVTDNDRASMVQGAKAFLESIVPVVEQSDLVDQIKKQESVVLQEEKKLKKLKDDQSDLEKKLKDNEKKQYDQENVLRSQRNFLDNLKSKKK
jgi:hypothetical protein